MHLGRKYTFASYLAWTKWEIGYLFSWSLFVTSLFEFLDWTFLAVPAPLLAVVGMALAIILGLKNQECHTRVREALTTWDQIGTASIIWANKLASTLGQIESLEAAARMKTFFYRHFAWLTALRFNLRETKTWENIHEAGNEDFLAELPTPESRSVLDDELGTYLSGSELRKVIAYRGDKPTLLLGAQYRALGALHAENVLADDIFVDLTRTLDDLVQAQDAATLTKDYPYARNYYSITLILVKAFVGIAPFAFFPYAQEIGRSGGIEHWTVWLNVVFSVFVGWIFLTLEKVGENSANPFEGGPNDVPISFIARQIEIEMRNMLGEHTELKPIEPKYNILF